LLAAMTQITSLHQQGEVDVVVLTTNHSAFDVDYIQEHAELVVDMRNMIKEAGDKVYKL
jgi:UDP-N-acetyl-D-glucosamine dehydrogenase